MKTFPRLVLLSLLLMGVACGGDDSSEPLDIEETANNTTANAETNNATTNNGSVNNNVVPAEYDVDVLLETTLGTGPSGFSTEVRFEVPENTQSVAITIVGESGVNYTLSYWRNGSDGSDYVVPQNWYQNSQAGPTLCLSCPNRIVSSDGAFAAMLPVNPDLEVEPGEHAIGVFTYRINGFQVEQAASSMSVKVIAKVRQQRPESGVVDINLFFTGSNGWTAATAPDDPEIQEILATVDEVWGQVGVKLGEITYNDIGEEFQVVEEATVPGGDLTELFSQSASAPREAVNVFFVEELMAGGPLGNFGVLLGVSGGIPGPTGVVGSDKSGVALISEPPVEAPTPIGLVFAHEVGHFLGLSHTSENALAGQTHDQLDDTPENDPQYLMHNQGSGNLMSVKQGIVMRLNPWTRNEEGAQ